MGLTKAIKKHVCDNCGEIIKSGDKYYYAEGREPRFDDEIYPSRQVGIQYWKYRLCLSCDMKLSKKY